MTARSATDYLSIRTNVCGRFVSAGIQEDRTFSLYYAICSLRVILTGNTVTLESATVRDIRYICQYHRK